MSGQICERLLTALLVIFVGLCLATLLGCLIWMCANVWMAVL